MTVETPQPRDRVRWQRTSVIEGVVEEITADGIVVRDSDGYKHLCQVEDATVEVLERADDPSKSLRGEIRSYEGVPVVCYGRDFWVYFMPDGGNGYGVYRDEKVVGAPVIGVVPGTPAAEAQTPIAPWEPGPRPQVRVPNEPHGPSLADRQKVADLLVAGDLAGAVRALRTATGMGMGESDAYLRSMPEYETYLNHHGGKRETCTRDDCPGGTRCSSGATVWHDKTSECEKHTEVDPTEANRMRAMGFDKQPELKVSDEQRAEITAVLEERRGEFAWSHDGQHTLDMTALSGVVADIVYAVRVQDRKRGDR